MKGLLKLHRNQAGFTLIELLVVIVILGILAAIALPNFTGMTETGKTEADATELDTVQTAMDVMMATEKISTVGAITTSTDNMSSFPGSPGTALYPNYMRDEITSENYTCTAGGQVSQVQK